MSPWSPKPASSFPDAAGIVSRRERRPPRLAAPVLALTLALVAPAGAAGADAPRRVRVVERPESELLLLGLRLGHIDLDVLLPAYPSPAGVLVPVGGLCRALALAVEVDVPRGWARVRWKQDLELDADAGRVRAGPRVLRCDSTCFEVHSDDIYAPASQLAAWMSVGLRVDLASSAITVTSARPLPIQEQAERRLRQQQILGTDASSPPDYPRLRPARRLWSVPFLDQTVRSTTLRGGGVRSARWEYTSFLAGELLYMEADARFHGDGDRTLREAAVGIGRRDPDPVLLGPLRAREFRGGEVFSPGLPLITLPATGDGALLSSFPLQRPTQFDRHTFRGRLPAGWDVELYRGPDLVGLQTSRPDGVYEFDAPLIFGANAYRLVFHGPHGERREESRVLYVGPSLAPPGRHHYRLAFCDPRSAGARAQVEADLSLGRRLSVALSAAQVALEDGSHLYAAGGLRASWHRLFLTADGAADSSGGTALEAGLQTLCGPLGVTLRQATLHRFRSEVFRPALGPIRSRSTARVDGVLPAARLRLPVQVELLLDRHTGGHSAWYLSQRAGLGVGSLALSHSMRRVVVQGAPWKVEPESRNTILLSAHARRWALRGACEYDPRRLDPPLDLSLTAEGPLGGVFAALGLNRNLQVDDIRGVLSLRRNEGSLGWSFRTEHGKQSGTSLSVALTVGIDYDPRARRWRSHAAPVAGGGAASAQVFLDTNGNGRRDETESLIEGASFVVGRAPASVRTGPRGTAFLSGLSGEQELDVGLAPSSLEDPLWIAERPGYRFFSRPGHSVLLEFPVRPTGEVWGSVFLQQRGAKRPVAGIALELVDRKTGQVVRKTTTAYDGFYEIVAVLPGQYLLRAARADRIRLRLREPVARQLVIAPEGAVLENADLVFVPDEPAIATDQ